MELARRLVRAINWMYVLYAVAAVSLLYILTTPMIIDPFIGFMLAGIVPGTDMVLSPEALLLILTDIFGLTLCIMLIVWLVQQRLTSDIDYHRVAEESKLTIDYEGTASRALRHIVTTTAIQKTAKLSSKASASNGVGTVSHVMRRSSTRAFDSKLQRQFSTAVTEVSILAVRCGKLALYLFVEGLYQVCVLFVRAVRLMSRVITWLFVFFIVLLGTLIDWCIRASAHAWTISKPALRRFDRWLEQRYREVGIFVLSRLRRVEILQVFAAVVRDSASSLRRLFIK